MVSIYTRCPYCKDKKNFKKPDDNNDKLKIYDNPNFLLCHKCSNNGIYEIIYMERLLINLVMKLAKIGKNENLEENFEENLDENFEEKIEERIKEQLEKIEKKIREKLEKIEKLEGKTLKEKIEKLEGKTLKEKIEKLEGKEEKIIKGDNNDTLSSISSVSNDKELKTIVFNEDAISEIIKNTEIMLKNINLLGKKLSNINTGKYINNTF